MKYPDYVFEKLEKEYERIEKSLYSIWSLMSPSYERDIILNHLTSAKIEIYKIIKEEK